MAHGELARLQRGYRALLDEIHDLGFIATGSVIERYTVCTAAGCRCHADPPQRHGSPPSRPSATASRSPTGDALTKSSPPWMTSPPNPVTCSTRQRQTANALGAANGTDRHTRRAGAYIRSQKCGTSAVTMSPAYKSRTNDPRNHIPAAQGPVVSIRPVRQRATN